VPPGYRSLWLAPVQPYGVAGRRDDNEGHRLDILARGDEGEVFGLTFQVSVHPAERSARFLAIVLDRGHRPVVLVDEHVPPPGRGWEIRDSGLWADLNCETPGVHWSYGLEAFALALDEPDQLVEGDRGDRVPLGWELDFESEDGIDALIEEGGSFVHRQKGTAHGLLLGPHRPIAIAGPAVRHHWRGADKPATVVVGAPGSESDALDRVQVRFDGDLWSCVLWSDGLRCALGPQRG
jgi:hypothetical protein